MKNQWDEKLFQESITEWVWKNYVIPVHNDNHSSFGRALGFKDGRKIRALLSNDRDWCLEDLGKLSVVLNHDLSHVIAQIEYLYNSKKNIKKNRK